MAIDLYLMGGLTIDITDQYVFFRSCQGVTCFLDAEHKLASVTYTNSKGIRTTTETAYLTPDVLRRPNLTIATHAQVTRILFDTSESKKRAVGVAFARNKDGPRYRVKARKEVILS